MFVAALGFIAAWAFSHLGGRAWDSHCSGLPCCRAQDLGHTGFSSCSTWAQQLRLLGSRAQVQLAAAHRLSCSSACGIFLDQGSNPCLLHWQADSSPLSHQGSLVRFFKSKFLLETHNDTCKSDIWGFTFKCCRRTLGCRESGVES